MRLWITGAGLVTPLGAGVEATWTRLVRGERAIGPVKLFSTDGQRVALAAEVPDVVVPGPGWSRSSAMAASAASEALASARLDVKMRRVGLVVGGTTGGMFETEQLLGRLHADPESGDALAQMLSHPLTATGDRLEERLGPFARVRTLSSACSSGANALVVAACWLLTGEVDAVLAGASDGLCRLTLSGFNALGAIDHEPCRPFDVRRRGTSLGEGAGFVVLERDEAAHARGAQAIAELAGWALGAEAHHITNPAPDGAIVASLIERAMSRAGLSPGDVDYINAHGTGTAHNDPMEAAALARALGGEIRRVPVSSSKAQLGHSLAASGAIEAVITALVVQRRTLVPTAGLEQPDPALPLVHVQGRAREVSRVRAALSCAYGFGGMDAVLALAKPGLGREHAAVEPGPIMVTGVGVAGACGVAGATKAASIPEGSYSADAGVDADAILDAARARRLDAGSKLGVVAAERALTDAGAIGLYSGILLGSAFGNVDGSAAFMHRIFEKGPRAASPAEFPNLVPSSPVGHASIYLHLQGPALATADLATSGESAVIQAMQLLAAGEAERVVAGAVELRSPIVRRVLAALFSHTPALARGERASVAAALVLETPEQARSRGARVLARVRRALEWRQDAAVALRQLAAPLGARPEVVLARLNEGTEALLEGTAWAACPRVTCSQAMGESDGLGAVALAVAASRVGAGACSDALVVGVARGRGYLFVLSAP